MMKMKKEKHISPPMVSYSFLLISIVLHFFFPIIQIINFPYTLSGILLIIIGLVINTQGNMILNRNKTTIKIHERPSALIIEGPFRFTRNPIYLGGMIFLLGIALLLGSLIAFFAPIATFITMEIYFIPIEERNLQEAFGKRYLDYKNRVRRWI